jgi:hypothetical protein
LNDGREDRVRKTDQIISRALELWPLWLTLLGGGVTAINFYNKVNDLIADQKAWKQSAETRRESMRKEIETINTRLAVLETRQLLDKK